MTGQAPPAAAEIRELRITYGAGAGAVHAVQGASLQIADGETVALVGESGSGKSTLARAILGLLDPAVARITGGAIVFGGRDLTRLSPREWERMRGNPVAMIFQDPMTYLNPVMTAGAQIGESVRLHDRGMPAAPRVDELLDMVKLPRHAAAAFPDELSGGMRQRVLLAVALGCRPRLLIADEPTTALDVATQAEIMQLLRELQAATGMAMLLISHDLHLVSSTCRRVYVMYSGRTVEWGGTADIFRRPAHPYTRGLLAAADGRPRADGSFPTIPGDPPDLRMDPPGCPFQPRCAERSPGCAAMPAPTPAGSPGHFVRCVAANGREVRA